jgi:hypothetical protein
VEEKRVVANLPKVGCVCQSEFQMSTLFPQMCQGELELREGEVYRDEEKREVMRWDEAAGSRATVPSN